MYNPIESGASFLELYNRSAQSSFDLSGWRVDGARFVFPPGTVIEPNGFVTIVKDRTIFAQVYGDYVPVAGQFAGGLDNVGEALTLLIPGRVPSQNVVIDKVRYESALPWPSFAAGGGAALQLVDSGQDNSRVASWSDGYTNLPPGVSGPELATPGRSNSVSGTLPPFPPLWLNEAQAENTRGLTTQAGQRGPWIELFNSGTNALELAGFYLSDNFAGLTRWAFPAGSTVGPGQFVIVWADGEPGLSTASEWHTDFRLSPTNGAIFLARLLAGQPQLLDYLNYTDLKPDFSYGSFPDGQVTDREVFSFVTAGRSNSVPALVFINEWMASNLAFLEDEADSDFEDWIELYNGTGHPLDLSGYYLTDTLTNATQWRVPDGTVIDPHGYLLVWADGEPAQASLVTADLHANFQLSRNGETIGLFSPDLKLVDTISFGPQSNNVSQGRSPDGSTNIITLTLPTPRGPNYTRPPSLPAPPPSVIVPGQPNRLALLDPPSSLGLGTFMLEPGAPPGLTLDPVLGILTWTPPSDQPPGNYVVTLCFCDVRGVTVCGTLTLVIPEFKLSILGIVPLPDGNIRLQGESQPGRTHSMQFLDDLGSGTWVNWQDSFIPATTPFFITVPPGANGHRFYRLLRY